MIHINLLPNDMRKSEGLPLRRIGALALGASVVSASLMLLLTVHFGLMQTARGQHGHAEQRLAGLTPDVKYADALSKEKAEYKRRSETIQTISDSRVLWTKKVDQLFDVIDFGEKADRHFVWLNDLKVSAPRSSAGKRKEQSGGELEIRGFSATEDLQKYSDFHEDLKKSAFFEDFSDINDPAGKVMSFQEDVHPQKAWDFNLKMTLLAAEERAKQAKTAAEKPKAASDKKAASN